MSEYAGHNDGDPRVPSMEILPIVLSTRAVVVEADRSLKFEQDQPRKSKYSEILEKLHSPDFQTEEILRQILVQMTLVIIDMKSRENDPNAAVFRRARLADLRALGALIKQVNKTDRLRHHNVFDFEGPKFQYVFKQLVDYFKQAAMNALGKGSEELVKRFMMEFRDIVGMKDEEPRRNTQNIR